MASGAGFLVLTLALGMDKNDKLLHELARPSIRIISDCHDASAECAVAVDKLIAELKAASHVDLACLTTSIEGHVAKAAKLLERLERDQTRSVHYSWIRARVASFIYNAISTTHWQKGGGVFLCVGMAFGIVDKLCSSILARQFKQRTGN